MYEKFHIFDYKFNNEELESEFNNFFYKWNLTPLLTNEHRSTPITVTWVDARSVLNEGGSYNRILKEFSDILQMNWDNKSYEEALFKMIYEARSFQALMNTIKKFNHFVHNLDDNIRHNMWNIVWYTKEVY